MSKGWDSVTLKKLKALTVKGLSTSEIGKRLGMSKNAIVGKLNRLGWNAKAGGAPVSDKKTDNNAKAEKSKKTTATAAKSNAKADKKVVATKKTTVTEKNTKKTTEKVTATAKKSVTAKTTTKGAIDKKVKAEPAVKSNTKADAKNLAMHQRIIQHSLEMANLKPNQCRWPIGDPDSEHFHFCGETVFVGKPYCYEHCKQAYQFTPPKKK